MYSLQRYIQSLCIGLGLIVLLSACSQPLSTKAAPSTHTIPDSTTRKTVTQSCPQQGSARAAVMPTIAVGNHANLLYTSQSTASNVSYDATTLWRYDTATASTAKLITGNISKTASISPNGQWALLTAKVEQQWALQLIRMDGQELQTLYCAPGLDEATFSPDQRFLAFVWQDTDPAANTSGTSVYTLALLDLTTGKLQTVDSGHGISNLLFSPDQRFLAFVKGTDPNSNTSPTMNILDLTTGKHHEVLSLQQASFPTLALANFTMTSLLSSSGGWNSLIPLKWLQNNGLLVRIGRLASPNSVLRLYLLQDISKDASQQQNNLEYITGNDDPHDPCEGFDVTADNQQLLCSHYDRHADAPGEQHFPSVIKTRPLLGGTFHTIYQVPTGTISIEAICNSNLLISGPTELLWKMNSDGSGQAQLLAATKEEVQATICHDALYALTTYATDKGETKLIVGSLASGAPKTLTTTQDMLTLVGWTHL